MVAASAPATSGSAILPEKAVRVKGEHQAQTKRLEVCKYLCMNGAPSDRQIALLCGVNQSTVSRYRSQLRERGVDFVKVDGRQNSGRKLQFERAYQMIADRRRQKPECGGRDLWKWLVSDMGLPEDEVPSISGIDRYCSVNKMVTPRGTKIGQNGQYWLTDAIETIHDRAGMDETFPFVLANGVRFKLVSVRDCHTGAVYGEPFAYELKRDQRGLDPSAFAAVYCKYVQHIGVPRVLVVDNGGGQIIQDGWLPQFVRQAIEAGSIVDYEPYGTPTQNAHVERWNQEIQKFWNSERKAIYRTEHAFPLIRKRCWEECSAYPRYNLKGNCPPASLYPMQKWDFGGENSELPDLSDIARGGNTRVGHVRMHRRVESRGMIQTHGEDYIRVSDQLTGSKVRVDLIIEPGGGGEFSVIEPHGQVVMTGRHRIEQGMNRNQRMCFDFKEFSYHGGETGADSKRLFNQAAYDRDMISAHKRDRSKGFMAALAAVMAEPSACLADQYESLISRAYQLRQKGCFWSEDGEMTDSKGNTVDWSGKECDPAECAKLDILRELQKEMYG